MVSIFPIHVPIRIIASFICRPLIFIDPNTNYVLSRFAQEIRKIETREREKVASQCAARVFFSSPHLEINDFSLDSSECVSPIRQWETRDARPLTSTGDYRACGALHVHHVYIIKSSPKPLISFLDIPAWKRKVSPLDPRRSSVARGERKSILPGRFRAVDDRDL